VKEANLYLVVNDRVLWLRIFFRSDVSDLLMTSI
jgi:hypothetical protein